MRVALSNSTTLRTIFTLAYKPSALPKHFYSASAYNDIVGNVTFAVGKAGNVRFVIGNPVRVGKLVTMGGLGPSSHG
jgi:hypothetical protein